jgi:hypothetical protein
VPSLRCWRVKIVASLFFLNEFYFSLYPALLGIFPVTVFLRSVMDQDNHQFFKTGRALD